MIIKNECKLNNERVVSCDPSEPVRDSRQAAPAAANRRNPQQVRQRQAAADPQQQLVRQVIPGNTCRETAGVTPGHTLRNQNRAGSPPELDRHLLRDLRARTNRPFRFSLPRQASQGCLGRGERSSTRSVGVDSEPRLFRLMPNRFWQESSCRGRLQAQVRGHRSEQHSWDGPDRGGCPPCWGPAVSLTSSDLDFIDPSGN